jgi:hypothetical protein
VVAAFVITSIWKGGLDPKAGSPGCVEELDPEDVTVGDDDIDAHDHCDWRSRRW